MINPSTIRSRVTSRRTATGPIVFNCLECCSGRYLPCAVPTCVACGARAPADIVAVMTALEAKPDAA